MDIERAVYTQTREGEGLRVKPFTFVYIEPQTLPAGILEKRAQSFDLAQVQFAAMCTHENGVRTYRISLLPKGEKESLQQTTFFVDYLDNKEIGYLRMDFENRMSFARNMHTETVFEERGLAAQRLVMANQFSLEQYRQPLHSGQATLPEGRRVWKSLVQKGFVEHMDGRTFNHTYRFKSE